MILLGNRHVQSRCDRRTWGVQVPGCQKSCNLFTPGSSSRPSGEQSMVMGCGIVTMPVLASPGAFRTALADIPLAEGGDLPRRSMTFECRVGYKWSMNRVYLHHRWVACLPGTGHVGVSAQGTNAAALAQSRHQLREMAGIRPLATGRPQCGCHRRCRVVIFRASRGGRRLDGEIRGPGVVEGEGVGEQKRTKLKMMGCRWSQRQGVSA